MTLLDASELSSAADIGVTEVNVYAVAVTARSTGK